MIRRQLIPAALFILALTSCASAPPASSSVPSDREVVAYVTTTWDHYDQEFAFLSDRQGQSPIVLSVRNVECVPDGDDAKCTFVVRGRFGDGAVVSQPMESFFARRPDGSIEVLIPVVYN